MNICAVGDVHGRIGKLYKCIEKFESELEIKFDAVLQAGDFGIWINESYHDGITKFHRETGDFPAWYREKREVPVKTYFINGNNEDFNFLSSVKLSGEYEILKNLFYIPNGAITEITINKRSFACSAINGGGNTTGTLDIKREQLVVAGIGGKYSPEHFTHSESDRHYTKKEIEKILEYVEKNKGGEGKSIDIFISHDAPEGVLIEDSDKNKYYPKALGLRELILKIEPKMVVFGHHHGVCKSDIEGIPVFGLNLLGHKGAMLSTVMKYKTKECFEQYSCAEKHNVEKYFEKPVIK